MEKVDEFLYDILKRNNEVDFVSKAASTFLQKSEETILIFISSSDRSELEFPPLNSFYRRIIHRLGRRYNLAHRVEATTIFNAELTLRKVFLTKPVGENEDLLPILKCVDWLAERENGREKNILVETAKIKYKPSKSEKKMVEDSKGEDEAIDVKVPKFKILKRSTPPQPETFSSPSPSSPSSSNLPSIDGLSLEEREAKYQAARDRIFEGFKGEETDESILTVNNSEYNECLVNDYSPNYNDYNHCSESIVNHPVNNNTNTNTSPLFTFNSQLNPDAVPFTLPLPPKLEINHIYLVKAKSKTVPLTRSDLKSIISTLSSGVTIKTRILPCDSAFLLTEGKVSVTGPEPKTETEAEMSADKCKWVISKWVPEVYLD